VYISFFDFFFFFFSNSFAFSPSLPSSFAACFFSFPLVESDVKPDAKSVASYDAITGLVHEV
jgi:hypothetical protein